MCPAGSTTPGGPIGGQTRVTLRNEHMQYMVTWYESTCLEISHVLLSLLTQFVFLSPKVRLVCSNLLHVVRKVHQEDGLIIKSDCYTLKATGYLMYFSQPFNDSA